MNCDDAIARVLRDVDGHLDEGEKRDLDAHLAACDRCREAAVAQRDVAMALASRPEDAVSSSFAARVAERIARGEGPDWLRLADWRWLSIRLAPAAAALLIVGAAFLERERQSSQPPPLSAVVETWANTTAADRDQVPVTSVLWQSDVNDDAALLTVLTAPPDATVARQPDEQ